MLRRPSYTTSSFVPHLLLQSLWMFRALSHPSSPCYSWKERSTKLILKADVLSMLNSIQVATYSNHVPMVAKKAFQTRAIMHARLGQRVSTTASVHAPSTLRSIYTHIYTYTHTYTKGGEAPAIHGPDCILSSTTVSNHMNIHHHNHHHHHHISNINSS